MAANTGPGDRPHGSPAGKSGGDRLGVLAGAYSGRVLGALLAALGAQGGFLGSRTAKRYFAGEVGTDANRRRVFAETGAALVDAGFVRTSALLRRSDVAISVAQASLRWDRVLATLQSRSGAVGEAVVESALRLAVVDLALRAFAGRRLAGQGPPRPGTPSWALDNGGGRMLRRMAREAGVTRDGLVERLGASERAVDNWLDGRNRPTDANIEALAHALAAEGTADRVAREIRRCFALPDLADRAASQLGRERVREFAAAGVRFVRRIMADVDAMDRAPVGTAALAELTALRFGTAHAMSHPLLRDLALDEADGRWRAEIEASMRPWGLRLQRVAVGRGAGPAAAGLARAAADVDGYRDGGGRDRRTAPADRDAAAPLRDALGTALADPAAAPGTAAGLRRTAARLRAVARAHPESPQAHYEAGAFMGMAGRRLGSRELLDEGIRECRIAAALLPGWDAPAVEPAIVLANAGEFEAAGRELDRAEAWLGGTPPHLLLCRGYVRMETGRHGEALADLEAVLETGPDYALALGWASRCAFECGDDRKGRRLARRAMRRGEPDAYREWRRRAGASRARGDDRPGEDATARRSGPAGRNGPRRR